LGYKTGESSRFDTATERAVRAFQSGRKLQVSGRVNYETRKKLQEELDKLLKREDTQKQKALELLMEKLTKH
jgi:peptidoglycan hydrolase-like protein with peptidoglycan-binding domain